MTTSSTSGRSSGRRTRGGGHRPHCRLSGRRPRPSLAYAVHRARRPRCSPTTTSSPWSRQRCAPGPPTAPSVFEMFARRLPDGRRYGVVAGHRPGCSTRWRRSGSATRSWASSASTPSSTTDTLDWLAAYRFTGDDLGVRRGRRLLPGQPDPGRRGDASPRRCCSRRCCCRSSTTTRAVASAASRMTARRRRQALHRDGLPPYPRMGRGGGRPGGVRRRLRVDLQPPGGPRLRRADAAAPRPTPSRCCTTRERDAFAAQVESLGAGTTLLVDTYDIARGRRDRGRHRRPRPRRRAASTPATSSLLAKPGTPSARRAGRHEDPHHRHRRPRRVLDGRARPAHRSTATASAPRW